MMSDSALQNTLATKSAPPPAGYGTTTRTERAGQVCAVACPASSVVQTIKPAASRIAILSSQKWKSGAAPCLPYPGNCSKPDAKRTNSLLVLAPAFHYDTVPRRNRRDHASCRIDPDVTQDGRVARAGRNSRGDDGRARAVHRRGRAAGRAGCVHAGDVQPSIFLPHAGSALV